MISLLIPALFTGVSLFAQAPPNDDCANAIEPIECHNLAPSGNLGTCSVSAGPPNIDEICDLTVGSPPSHDCVNPGATCEPVPGGCGHAFRCQFVTDNQLATTDGPNTQGGPTPTCLASGIDAFQADVWYQVIAPCDAFMTIQNCADSDYDSIVQVYGNHSPACVTCPIADNLLSRGCSDDNCGVSGGGSALRVPVVGGACYTIRVGGKAGASEHGTSTLDVGMVTPCDACGFFVFPAAPASPPHDRRKNRYISFAPNNFGFAIGFRVQKLAHAANAGFCTGPGATGAACTGSPNQGTCGSGQTCMTPYPGGSPGGSCWVQTPVQTGPDQYTANCDATPVFRLWNEPVVHVGDCEILPVSTYQVRTVLRYPWGATVENPTPFVVQTTALPAFNNKFWGDTVGVNNGIEWTPPNQFTNVNDVLGILAYITNAAVKPHFTVANLQAISSPDSCLNALVNTADVLISVRAISGDSYGPPSTGKIVDPTLCPVCP